MRKSLKRDVMTSKVMSRLPILRYYTTPEKLINQKDNNTSLRYTSLRYTSLEMIFFPKLLTIVLSRTKTEIYGHYCIIIYENK